MEILLVLLAVAGLWLLIAGAMKSGEPASPTKATQQKPSPAERRARAQDVGIIHRSEYLEPESERESLVLDGAGLPTAALELVRDRLVLVTNAGWVNPKSRSLGRVGLYSFQIKATSYYEAATKAADFRPGVEVILDREPSNEHDANAVAIYGTHGRKVGYVNKQNAAKLAKRLDAGEDIVAISTRGAGARSHGTVPHILAAERRAMEHLARRLD